MNITTFLVILAVVGTVSWIILVGSLFVAVL